MASKSDGLSCVGEEGGNTELQQQQPVTPGNTKTAATGKLESLSKDDLIKFTKKQILLQQKMKTKCEELTKKLQQKSDETDSNIQYKMLKAEYEVMKAEREELLAAYSQSQQAQERYLQEYQELESHIEILKQEKDIQNAKIQTLSHDNKALEEQLDCMKMKDETMATTFQCIQQEQNAVVDENKALKQEMIVLSRARDDMMLAMKSLQQSQKTEDVNESAADGSNRHYETLQQEMNKIGEQLKDAVRIKTDLERENSELRLVSEKQEALVKQKVKMLEYIKELETENDEHQMALEKLKSEKENVTKDFAVFRKSSSNFKERLEEATRLMKDIQNQRDGLLKERDDAIKESQDNQSQVESCQMGIAKLTKISHKLKTENEELNQRNDALEKCVTEMYGSNETKKKKVPTATLR